MKKFVRTGRILDPVPNTRLSTTMTEMMVSVRTSLTEDAEETTIISKVRSSACSTVDQLGLGQNQKYLLRKAPHHKYHHQWTPSATKNWMQEIVPTPIQLSTLTGIVKVAYRSIIQGAEEIGTGFTVQLSARGDAEATEAKIYAILIAMLVHAEDIFLSTTIIFTHENAIPLFMEVVKEMEINLNRKMNVNDTVNGLQNSQNHNQNHLY